MNNETRTEAVEVLFNPTELAKFSSLCKALGVAKSTYLRGLANVQVQTHGSGGAQLRESRHCRGLGRPASRASLGVARKPLRL